MGETVLGLMGEAVLGRLNGHCSALGCIVERAVVAVTAEKGARRDGCMGVGIKKSRCLLRWHNTHPSKQSIV